MPRIGSRGAISMAVSKLAGRVAFIVITSKVGCKEQVAAGLEAASEPCLAIARRRFVACYFSKGLIQMADLSEISSKIDESKIVTFPDSPYKLHQPFPPAGDQPVAISKLVEGIEDGLSYQTLLGVTGSGKTYTMA